MEAPVAIGDHERVAQATTSYRIPAFDFTKGALVLFMVLYHWLNYFYGPDGKIYTYLRFLTPSFILITGFLISHVHIAKYGIGSPKLPGRLFTRGLKLIAVFVALNLMIGLFLPGSSVRTAVINHPSRAVLESIFVTGNVFVGGVGRTASFGILVSIGYLLIVSAIVLIACKFYRYGFHVLLGLLAICILVLDLHGRQTLILEQLAVGVLGVVLGYASGSQIQKLVQHPIAIIVAYCAYLAAITMWDAPYPMRLVGVCLTTLLIYMVGAIPGEAGTVRREIILLGKYSLWGYIAQIAILQVLRAGYRHATLGVGAMTISFALGVTLTIASVEFVDRARARSRIIDRLYRAVFA
jgi:peptidoglycan/LPS O-acetylase OafA/YrhL